jgi:DNA-directed RNA polymerase specialized sigma subunit
MLSYTNNQELIESLVKICCSKYKQYSNYEDLRQEARLVAFQALSTFNPKKQVPLGYWLAQYIKTKVAREANKYSTVHIPMQKLTDETRPIYVELSNIGDIGRIATTQESNIIKAETLQNIKIAISWLSDDDKESIKTIIDCINDQTDYMFTKVKVHKDVARKLKESIEDLEYA